MSKTSWILIDLSSNQEVVFESGVNYRNLSFLGYPDYWVGTDGSVWSKRRWRERFPLSYATRLYGKPFKSKCNIYHRVELHNDKESTLIFVHRLVLLAFVGEPKEGEEACHFPDRDGRNNKLDNLSWGLKKINQSHKIIHKTDISGTRNINAKLNHDQVKEIREDYLRDHGLSQRGYARKNAKRFGISEEAMRALIGGHSYKNE